MDIVCKGQYYGIIAVVVLESYLSKGISLSTRNINYLAAESFKTSCSVDMLYELTDTALIVESFRLDIVLVALIRKYYLYACVKESLLAETL